MIPAWLLGSAVVLVVGAGAAILLRRRALRRRLDATQNAEAAGGTTLSWAPQPSAEPSRASSPTATVTAGPSPDAGSEESTRQDRIGRFRLRALLGQGAFGRV